MGLGTSVVLLIPLDTKIPRGKKLEGCYRKQNKTHYTKNVVKTSLNQVPKLKKKKSKEGMPKAKLGESEDIKVMRKRIFLIQ